MKKVVVIYKSDDWRKSIPFTSAHTRKSFEDWHERGLKEKIEFHRASINWFDEKNNTFKKTWAYRDKKWKRITKPVKPDFIYDKLSGQHDYSLFEWKTKIAGKIPIFNTPIFRAVFGNKLSQYLIFKEFMPTSVLISTKKELNAAISSFHSNKIVVKPLYGFGGFGILIDKKSKILKSKIQYPVLAQEFIKSEKGIPGFSKNKEVSDLRLVFINHKLIYALSRIAKKGSLFTNFHQGATAIIVPETTIPVSIKKMVKKIIEKIKIFPQAHYSLDFIFSNQGKPFLIEMNTTPGFDLLYLVGDEKIKKKHFKEFCKIIHNG